MTLLTQDVITRLISRPPSEEPFVTLYLLAWGSATERKATLKNLHRAGESAIEADTGWDDERKKSARGLLEQARAEAERLLAKAPSQGRGSHAVFVAQEGLESLSLPLDLRDRLVVDRSPYASPLSSLIDQYERYGVILCDQKKARLFEVYLGQIEAWEELESDHERSRSAPAGGPARQGGSGATDGGYHGLEELRRRNHAQYVLHKHLRTVVDRAFRRYKLRPYERLVLAGSKELLPKLEEHLHSYMRARVVAREAMAVDLSKDRARDAILRVEARVEEEKERDLLREIKDRVGRAGLATSGRDETLRSLFFGKVRTLVVSDNRAVPGRECPECHFLFERPEDAGETTPTLVECPICKRATRRVPDIIDEAVELAILSGARVEHIAYAKEALVELGGMAAVLRFK